MVSKKWLLPGTAIFLLVAICALAAAQTSTPKVKRGWLGVVITRVTPEIAEALGLNKPQGALVSNVYKDGPADRSGVKVGDVITEFDGKEIRESGDLPLIVARTPINRKVRLKVIRDKQETALTVTIGEVE